MIRSSRSPDDGNALRSGLPLPPATLIGFVVAIVAVVVIAVLNYRLVQDSSEAAERVLHTHEVLGQLQTLLSTLKDAETGQRGYLLTGTEPYLAPYVDAKAALAGDLETLRAMTGDNSEQQRRLDSLGQLIADKTAELDRTIALRRSGDTQSAPALVDADRGKAVMDRIRGLVSEMMAQERDLLAARERISQETVRLRIAVTSGGYVLLLILLAVAGLLATREHRQRQTEVWVRAGQMGLSQRLEGERTLADVGDQALAFLAGYLNAQVGAVYVAEGGDRLRRVAAYAVAPGSLSELVAAGDGLLGQALKEDRALHVQEVPEGFLPVSSGLGQGQPREVMIAPATVDDVVHAVLELGFFRRVLPAEKELLARVSESLAVAVRAASDRTRLNALLEETQQQAEELQAQQEELQANNDELEAQGNVLKQAQAQLEAQHAELEQSNAQLEAHADELQVQRDELAKAQDVLRAKAAELERANLYKSEFLANMSHELRTPLNSSLILAKLLADNKQRNLTPEQVRFAESISSSGNDLLALINDILDLSKIEAGKVDLVAEPVLVANMVDSLVKTFQPVARKKGLAFSATLDPGTPPRIITDGQRMGQILKNLLSNALKFTDQGQVSLRVGAGDAGTVSFAVSDSGIGIAQHQQDIIFEAFRQADGSTHRKYGGTGLGLSISRDLAHLLGGGIAVQSTAGQGSVFTLTLPQTLEGGAAIEAVPQPPIGQTAPPSRLRAVDAPAPALSLAPPPPPLAAPALDDDRERLHPGDRVILVIEDDQRFAAILRDLAREQGFQCVVTHSADDGMAAALAYRPGAILLDIHLPDRSGLGVLDQLKHNPATRHIPVHVASVADYTHQALEMGAVGYALKPVKREVLVDALRRLEAKISQRVKRVLVVEDDERQRDSIGHLLAAETVQISAVTSAAEALAALRSGTFDCMVMDLKLPDLSGFQLLAAMAAQEDLSFPPVIVYTGQSLTREQEQELGRFSRSIIIKDARSPERLLDEVTLFLHQVESTLPAASQQMLRAVRDKSATLEGRGILVAEDDIRNVFALSSVLEPQGAKVVIARNGNEAIEALTQSTLPGGPAIDLVLMDIMMPEMDGLTAMREIRKRPEWKRLPIIALTARAMKGDQDKCFAAGANDYIAKPLDVERLLSLVRVWMPK